MLSTAARVPGPRPGRTTVALLVAMFTAISIASPVSAGLVSPQIDKDFGGGSAVFDVRGTRDLANGVIVRPDGYILVGLGVTRVAQSGVEPAFIQLKSGGTLDADFQGAGDDPGHVVITESPGSRSLVLVDFALDALGNTVVLARTSDSDPDTTYVFRFDPDGDLLPWSGPAPTTFRSISFPNVDEHQWRTLGIHPMTGTIILAGTVTLTGDPVPQAAAQWLSGTSANRDAAFATNGIFTASPGDGPAYVEDVAFDADGQHIGLVIDCEDSGGIGRVCVQQLDSIGDPDAGFGTGGAVMTGFGATEVEGVRLAYQTNDRLVVLGHTTTQPRDPILVRYTTGGVLDSAFSGDGKLRTTIPGFEVARALFVAGNGPITVFGQGNDGIATMRLTGGGVLDTTLDGDGRLVLGAPTPNDLRSGTVAAGGSIVTVGTSSPASDSDVVVNRFASSGVPDGTFGPVGIHRYPHFDVDEQDVAEGVALDSTGRTLIGATVGSFVGTRMAVMRLLPNGYRDTPFGGRGFADATFPDAQARAVAADSNRAIVVGCRNCDTAPDFAVARFDAAGEPDTTFSGDGHVATTFGAGLLETATAVAVQADRKIVVAGTVGDDVALVRYNVGGGLDSTFSGDGRVQTDIGTGSVDAVTDVVIQPNGRIIVVGSRTVGVVKRVAVLRYRANGTLDNTFSGDGKVVTTIGPSQSEAVSVALRPDGRILVGAFTHGATIELGVLRYLANGTLDSAFDGDGRAIVLLDFDEGIMVGVEHAAGNRVAFGAWVTSGQFLAGRLLPGGGRDQTFGDDGLSLTPFVDEIADARDMTIDPAGGIILVGQQDNGNNFYDIAAVRFDP